MQKDALLSLQGDVGYRNRLLIRGADFQVLKGSFTAVIGPNGAGKSTLLKTLLQIIRPCSGRVWSKPDLKLGYVPQGAALDSIFPLRVFEVVSQGSISKGQLFARGSREKVLKALDRVQMSAFQDKAFRDLSGGQKQRVLIARALYREPEILFLDEPTAGLDWPTESGLLDQLVTLHREGKAILWIAHHLGAVLNRVQTVVAIDIEKHLRVIPIEKLTGSGLEAIYQQKIEIYKNKEGLRAVRYVEGEK